MLFSFIHFYLLFLFKTKMLIVVLCSKAMRNALYKIVLNHNYLYLNQDHEINIKKYYKTDHSKLIGYDKIQIFTIRRKQVQQFVFVVFNFKVSSKWINTFYGVECMGEEEPEQIFVNICTDIGLAETACCQTVYGGEVLS